MRIIEIVALENGAHRNVSYDNGGVIPAGWAIVPATLDTPNFPFGNITVDEQTPPVVIAWEPLPIPEPKVILANEVSDTEILNALLGVSENE